MHPIKRLRDGFVTVDELFWNPQVLYHYTTREGLNGILSTGGVWATNIRFLNDASEYRFPQSNFLQKLREILEDKVRSQLEALAYERTTRGNSASLAR